MALVWGRFRRPPRGWRGRRGCDQRTPTEGALNPPRESSLSFPKPTCWRS